MDRNTKLIIALVAGGAGYLLLTRQGVVIAQAQPIPVVSDRVMSYAGDMFRYGAEQGVNPALIASVMTVESGGRENAVGRVGEIGLMQILPATGMWIGNASQGELTVPSINIRVGTAYLRYTIDRKGGNVAAGIAGYNYGPDRVRVERGKIIAPAVVIQYMLNVLGYVDAYRRLFRERLGTFYDNAFPTKALII